MYVYAHTQMRANTHEHSHIYTHADNMGSAKKGSKKRRACGDNILSVDKNNKGVRNKVRIFIISDQSRSCTAHIDKYGVKKLLACVIAMPTFIECRQCKINMNTSTHQTTNKKTNNQQNKQNKGKEVVLKQCKTK